MNLRKITKIANKSQLFHTIRTELIKTELMEASYKTPKQYKILEKSTLVLAFNSIPGFDFSFEFSQVSWLSNWPWKCLLWPGTSKSNSFWATHDWSFLDSLKNSDKKTKV